MTMQPTKHTILLLVTIMLCYLWLSYEFTRPYTLQLFALLMILFFALKRSKQAKLWHILPDTVSSEMALITASFLLLIGVTGNVGSLFFPLSYVHLFFLVLASHPMTTGFVTLGVMLFHYLLTPNLSADHTSLLGSLPVLWLLFLFAKHQYDELAHKTKKLKLEEAQLHTLQEAESSLESFLTNYLEPKLSSLEEVAKNSPNTPADFTNQLDLLKSEVQKAMRTIRSISGSTKS